MRPTFSLSPVVRVNGRDLAGIPGADLIGMRIERGLRVLGRATLRLADPALSLSSGGMFAVGTQIDVALRNDVGIGGGTIFSGVVTAATLEFAGAAMPILLVAADDAALKLTRTSTTTTYADVTVADVVTQLAREAGVQADVTSPNDQVFEYLIQSGTPLQFIDDLAERYGVDWYVGGDDCATLTFAAPAPSSAAARLEVGENLRSFSVRANGLGPASVAANGWDPAAKNALGPSTAQVSSSPSGAGGVMGSFRSPDALGGGSYVSSAANPVSGADATALAGSMAERVARESLAARGEAAHIVQIGPGDLIEIAGAGPASGAYRVSRVEHVHGPDGLRTRFWAGGPSRDTLADALGPRRRDSFSQTALLSGVVTNNSDPAGLGRVQVMFGGIQDQDTSAWARIATPGAGANRGLVLLPEIGDEVLVGFEQGDILRPVVIGGLYNNSAKMGSYGLAADAGSSGGKVAQRSLISRKGYRMQIVDGESNSEDGVTVALTDGSDHMLRLGKDRMQVTLPAGIPLEVKVGQSAGIEIDDQGNVTIRGNKITLASDTDVVVGAKAGKVEASAPAGQVALSGTTFAVKATASGEINGGGTLTAKGGTVMIN